MSSFQAVASIGILAGLAVVIGLVAILFHDIISGWIQRRIAIRKTYGTFRMPVSPKRDEA